MDAGVVCAVDGGDNCDDVFGVERGFTNAHNVARRRQSIDIYSGHVRLCLKTNTHGIIMEAAERAGNFGRRANNMQHCKQP